MPFTLAIAESCRRSSNLVAERFEGFEQTSLRTRAYATFTLAAMSSKTQATATATLYSAVSIGAQGDKESTGKLQLLSLSLLANTALSIMTFSIMIFGIMGLIAMQSMTAISVSIECHYTESHIFLLLC